MLCFAFGCDHKSTNGTCTFKMFPKDKKKIKKWEDACRRQDSKANSNSSMCSCHFENGDFENTPSIFPWSKTKFVSPEKRTRKRRAVCRVSESSESGSTASSIDPVTQLQTKVEELQRSVMKLQLENEQLKTSYIPTSFQHVKGTPLVHYYTGLQEEVYEQLSLWLMQREISYVQGWHVLVVSKEDQIFLTHMKLRCNFDFIDLAFRFKVSEKTISNIFFTWVEVLHAILFPLIKMPSTSKNKLCLPSSFNKYTNCRVVVDCTEIEGEVPRQSLDESSRLYSGYKKRHTFKFLVGCAPNGVITFVSEAYPGNTSDKIIFEKSGINNSLVKGDMVLVDKGFLISDIVPHGVQVNLPHFLMNKQFTPLQINHNYEVANARIIIDRVNSRIKNYDIVEGFPHHMRRHATKVFQVVCCLVNLQNPLVADIPGRKNESTDQLNESEDMCDEEWNFFN